MIREEQQSREKMYNKFYQILMKIQKREKEPVDQEFSDKIESKKINQNNFEQKINIDQNINM